VPLSREDIDAFLARPSKSRRADLAKAYEIAKDPAAWNEEQDRIVKEHEEDIQEHGEEQESDVAAGEEEDDADERPGAARKRSSPQAAPPSKRTRSEPAETHTELQPDKEHAEEIDPATRRVREWRHRLQRAFLSKEGVIYASDMDAQDALFKTVEACDDMTVDQLRSTKIGKVMKRIHLLPEVPRDDEFHFRERAGELMKRWSVLLDQAAEDTEA